MQKIDGTIIAYENKPELNNNGFWYSNSGWDFEIPKNIVFDALGRDFKFDKTIQVELRKV